MPKANLRSFRPSQSESREGRESQGKPSQFQGPFGAAKPPRVPSAVRAEIVREALALRGIRLSPIAIDDMLTMQLKQERDSLRLGRAQLMGSLVMGRYLGRKPDERRLEAGRQLLAMLLDRLYEVDAEIEYRSAKQAARKGP